jgi:KAP family P-loop domain/Pentapeptide repeats (8 copies)
MAVTLPSEFEDEISKPSILKIITDEPTEEDALDFNNYSQKLANIITNSKPRFAVGIFGGWGTGKTSLMRMTKKILDDNKKVITVWFDAWRYEREENLAVIPFLRTIKLTLDASDKSREGRWEGVKNGVKRTAAAFLSSTKVTYGIKDIASAETDFGRIAESLKGNGSVGGDNGTIYYHVTEFLEKALNDLIKEDIDYRIVAFIDDLDRCSPDRALEVLESVKSFFDIEGMVYVIGMDSDTINSLVRKKYGHESTVKGLDYLQKIVQLPFQIPIWKEEDISMSISKIISKGLEGSQLGEEFENNKKLIVKAVELNPREVKRFINNIILAKSVFEQPVDELIAVQTLNFRHEWRKFLDLITPDEMRKKFFQEYEKIKEEGKIISNEEELDKFLKEISENDHPSFKDVVRIYRELLKQGDSLRDFLDVGAEKILTRIQKMEKHRRALDTTKLPPEHKKSVYDTNELKLLREGEVDKFNEFRSINHFAYLNLHGAELSEAFLSSVNLTRVDLSGANLTRVDLSGANLKNANLTGAELEGANLTGADLSGANLKNANLTGAELTEANLDNANLDGSILQGADCDFIKNLPISRADARIRGAVFMNEIFS